MKTVPKKALDAAIDAERKYYRSEVPLADLTASEKALAAATQQTYIVWSELLSAILGYKGLKKDATNEDIYAVLRVLGWEVLE